MTKFLTAEEIADVLGINKGTVYRLARSGDLRHLAVGRSLRFRLEDVVASFERGKARKSKRRTPAAS